MKKAERSARREKRAVAVLFVGTLTALVLFGVLLWTAIMSIDGARGLYKKSPDAPDSLVSLGAPRSQLDLRRMFSLMMVQYGEGDLTVCEPITAEYLGQVEARIERGEREVLSVEEVLYIISDSAELYDTVDVIRLMDSDGGVSAEIRPIKEPASESVPYHIAAERRLSDILSIITYRMIALSSPEVISETEGGYVYTPNYTEREGERSFTVTDEISFNTGNGGSVRLYPTDKQAETTELTVLLESKRALGRAEREVLAASGYDADLCRNVTPEYMYGKTDVRFVAVGGRVVLVDISGYVALDPLESGERLTSIALSSDGIYFTGASESGSSLWLYESGVGTSLMISTKEKYVAIYDDGDTLGLYAARRIESPKYISALVRSGEPIFTAEK